MYMYVCIDVCMCVCMYVYIYISGEQRTCCEAATGRGAGAGREVCLPVSAHSLTHSLTTHTHDGTHARTNKRWELVRKKTAHKEVVLSEG